MVIVSQNKTYLSSICAVRVVNIDEMNHIYSPAVILLALQAVFEYFVQNLTCSCKIQYMHLLYFNASMNHHSRSTEGRDVRPKS